MEVQQATGGGHQNVQSFFDFLHLRLLSHAAENDGRAQGQVLAVGFKAFFNLQCQLPGGGQNQGADLVLSLFIGLGQSL